jgi:hypothetical protein
LKKEIASVEDSFNDGSVEDSFNDGSVEDSFATHDWSSYVRKDKKLQKEVKG